MILNGDSILFKEDKDSDNYIQATVLANGKTKDNSVVFYITNNNGEPKVGYISEVNVKYIAPPTSNNIPTVEENKEIKSIINSFFITDNNGKIIEDVKKRFLSPSKAEDQSFSKTKYSLQEADENTFINKGDFLYSKSSGRVFKVLKVGTSGRIKTTILDNT